MGRLAKYRSFAICMTAFGMGLSGCGSDDTSARKRTSGQEQRAVVTDPGPRVPSRKTPFVRTAGPVQPLVVDKSPQKGECCIPYSELLESCSPNCDLYRRTRLDRSRVSWIASEIRSGEVRIVYPRNTCDGAPDEVIVRENRIEIYQYRSIDPEPSDGYSLTGCTADGGLCDSNPCASLVVEVTATHRSELDHAGVAEMNPPCRPWPKCEPMVA